MRALITLSLCSLLIGCGPYDGGDPRSQHEDGVVSQAGMNREVITSADAEAKAREERLAKQAERDKRIESQRLAAEAKAAEEAAAKAESGSPIPEEESDGLEPEPEVAEVITPTPEANSVPPLPRNLEVEGNLAALMAEEERLNGGAVGDTEIAECDEETETVPADPANPAIPAPEEDSAATPIAAAVPTVAVTPAATAIPAASSVPPIAALTGDALPPCDPNDLAAVALRELTLKQTFGEGEGARAVLVSRGGSEYTVAKGSVVGPEGARVVLVSPGELILAEIQFDMGGSPVMVQKALRMEPPR